MRRLAFDTNVLAYAAGLRLSDADDPKIRTAEWLVDDAFSNDAVVLPVQTCLELYHLLIRKARYSSAEAEGIVEGYAGAAKIVATDDSLMRLSFALAEAHRLQTFDAVIVAASARAGCEFLYSEDMQDGFEWGGVRVVNPFA